MKNLLPIAFVSLLSQGIAALVTVGDGAYVSFGSVADLVAGTDGTLVTNTFTGSVGAFHDGTDLYILGGSGNVFLDQNGVPGNPVTNQGVSWFGTNIRSAYSDGTNYVVQLSDAASTSDGTSYANGAYLSFASIADFVAGDNQTLLTTANTASIGAFHDGTTLFNVAGNGTVFQDTDQTPGGGTSLGVAWFGTDVRSIYSDGTNYIVQLSDTRTFDDGLVVPEPTSAALLGLGGLTLLVRRRR